MRLQRIRRCADAIRRPILPGVDPVHHLRPRGRCSVPLGGVARQDRALWLLVDDDLPRGAHDRLRLRMAQRGPRMGLIASPQLELPKAELTPAGVDYFEGLNAELSDKGFLLAASDDLINW